MSLSECRTLARHLKIDPEFLNPDAPSESDPVTVAALRYACEQRGVSYLPMTSRVYHDSLFMWRIAPVSMSFIPAATDTAIADEYASPEDIARGILVFADTLASLAE